MLHIRGAERFDQRHERDAELADGGREHALVGSSCEPGAGEAAWQVDTRGSTDGVRTDTDVA
jgi:hypothetical protein